FPKTAHTQSKESTEATAFIDEPPQAGFEHEKHIDSKGDGLAERPKTRRLADKQFPAMLLHLFFNKATSHVGGNAHYANINIMLKKREQTKQRKHGNKCHHIRTSSSRFRT